MELLKYLIPFVIFLLGVIVTLLIKKKERKDSIISETAKKISELSTTWYNQINSIYVEMTFNNDNDNARRELFHYKKDRTVLPHLLRTIETAKRYKDCDDLVFLTLQFLEKLTNNDMVCNYEELCKYLTQNDIYICNNPTGQGHNLEGLLGQLDILIQLINSETGKLIK